MSLRRERRQPRVFLGLQEIAGYYTRVRDGMLELGVAATFIDLSDHPFEYGHVESFPLARAIKSAMRRRQLESPRSASAMRLLLWEIVLRLLLLIWAVFKFDFFIFGFGSSFLKRPLIDLKVLKFFRKRVVFVFHGSDARPAYLDGSIATDGQEGTARHFADLARATEQRVSAIDRHADYIVDNALSAHFHKRPCVHWIVVGVPSVAPSNDALPNDEFVRSRRSVRILHSPSHPESKGTSRIRQAIVDVRARGFEIEYVEISGRPHADVLGELMRCDLVVDQLYSDTPMATFATEAAQFGKPAIVGGYGALAFQRMLPADAIPPVLYCHPDDLESSIERLVADPTLRTAMGHAAQRFVESRWTQRDVAARLLRLLQGSCPESWLFDPNEIRYCHGYGLNEDQARGRVAEIIAEGGVEALRLRDKPDLEDRLCNFARRKESPPLMPSCSSSF